MKKKCCTLLIGFGLSIAAYADHTDGVDAIYDLAQTIKQEVLHTHASQSQLSIAVNHLQSVLLLIRSNGDCARLFEHADFQGASFTMPSNTEILDLRDTGWNDQISSLTVFPGCFLIAFEHVEFGGWAVRYASGNVPYVGNAYNDQFSSLRCQCN